MGGTSNRYRTHFGLRRIAYYAETLWHSYRGFGLRATARFCAAEFLFDVVHGTRTLVAEDLRSATDIAGDHQQESEPYEAVNPIVFRTALREVADSVRKGSFVDYGCGKGRALILALESGFPHAIGVEFSERLCERARENLSSYARHEVVHADAACWVPPPDSTVFFFFNPFSAPVMRKVLSRVQESLAAFPRDHRIVYVNALHHDEVIANDFVEQPTKHGATFDYRIYRQTEQQLVGLR